MRNVEAVIETEDSELEEEICQAKWMVSYFAAVINKVEGIEASKGKGCHFSVSTIMNKEKETAVTELRNVKDLVGTKEAALEVVPKVEVKRAPILKNIIAEGKYSIESGRNVTISVIDIHVNEISDHSDRLPITIVVLMRRPIKKGDKIRRRS